MSIFNEDDISIGRTIRTLGKCSFSSNISLWSKFIRYFPDNQAVSGSISEVQQVRFLHFKNKHRRVRVRRLEGEWKRMNEWLFIPIHICERTGRELATWKRNAFNEIYSGNSLSVCICLTTAKITDGSHRWQICITFIKRLDSKTVVPHRCQILRLMNKTPPQGCCHYLLLYVCGV